MSVDWEESACALCGELDGTSVLAIPQPDAPAGVAHLWQCRSCGLRRLNPRPSPGALGHYYALAQGYNAFLGRTRSPHVQRVWDFLRDAHSRPPSLRGWRRIVAPLAAPIARWAFDINLRLDGPRPPRVLEIGSGYGDILIYLQQRGCDVLGVDPSPQAAEAGRRHGIDIRVGCVADLQLPDASFDAVILCHSLEHVPDPNRELGEAARLLRPEGQLHLAVPNGHAVRLTLDGLHWAHLSHPLHLWYFDARSLTRLLARHRLVPIRPPVTTSRHHPFQHGCREFLHGQPLAATRQLLRFLSASLRTPDGGDVLRLIAAKSPTPDPAPPPVPDTPA
ncbi:MAG: class I SAM-dependent methyltransferase [Verrucomicrobiae bacterium]|nr:class I SAM-dependent methyltransferase [Verrucomicrobiae bacterium]